MRLEVEEYEKRVKGRKFTWECPECGRGNQSDDPFTMLKVLESKSGTECSNTRCDYSYPDQWKVTVEDGNLVLKE